MVTFVLFILAVICFIINQILETKYIKNIYEQYGLSIISVIFFWMACAFGLIAVLRFFGIV